MKKLLTSLLLVMCCFVVLCSGCASGNSNNASSSSNTDSINNNATTNNDSNSEQKLPTSITLSENNIEMFIGETYQLYATVSPFDDTANIKWTSLNSDVVTVGNNGNLKALTSGTTVIRATTENNLAATCTVKVSQAVGNLTVDVTYQAKAGTLADKKASLFLIPEKIESFPTVFRLYTSTDYSSYGIISGTTDTSGKKTFNNIPVGKYRIVIQSDNAKYGAQTNLDIIELTTKGEKIIENIFGETLYNKLQALKDLYTIDTSRQYSNYSYLASSISFNICYGKTVEITNGNTQSISKHFSGYEGGV